MELSARFAPNDPRARGINTESTTKRTAMAIVYRYDLYDRALMHDRRSEDYATPEAIERHRRGSSSGGGSAADVATP